MTPHRESSRLFASLLLVVSFACGDDTDNSGWTPGDTHTVHLMTGWDVSWEMLPHRLSALELAYAPAADDTGGVFTVRNDGGTWGTVPGEFTTFSYGLEVWETTHLAAVRGSLTVEIPPAADNPDAPFLGQGTLTVPGADLSGAAALVAVIAGWRLSTDEYETVPAFVDEIPYDPAWGYTTQGFGVRLGEPQRAGEAVTVDVQVRNSLGIADRGDNNAAVPLASTWLHVDVLVLGAFGSGAAVTRGTTEYFISGDTYGQKTVHEHGSAAEQRIAFTGPAATAQALFGVTGFELWLNLEGLHDPACTVVSNEHNYEGDPISGPGRYLRQASARLHEMAYEPATGRGETQLDLYFTNSSLATEVGNVCLGVWGEAAMVQFDDAAATTRFRDTVTATADSGITVTEEVTY